MEIVKGKRYVFKIDGQSYKGTGTDLKACNKFCGFFQPFIDVTAFQIPETKVLPTAQPESTVVWVNMDKVTFIAEVQ